MLIELVNKLISIREPVLKDTLIFLVKTYLKPVLDNFQKINHYEFYLCNIHIELYRVCIEVQMISKQVIIELVRLNATEDVIWNASY